MRTRSLVADGLATPALAAKPELQLGALRGTLGDIQAEPAEYDALHDARLIAATGIEQLPTALIRTRITRGLTQRQLAEPTDRLDGAGRESSVGTEVLLGFCDLYISGCTCPELVFSCPLGASSCALSARRKD